MSFNEWRVKLWIGLTVSKNLGQRQTLSYSQTTKKDFSLSRLSVCLSINIDFKWNTNYGYDFVGIKTIDHKTFFSSFSKCTMYTGDTVIEAKGKN